jgi:DNA adenine methylase Dam
LRKLFKSPMNYLGNKYKVLPKMIDVFPDNINTFYDLFCGGLDVSLNIVANEIIANDKHRDLIWLYNEIKNYKNSNLGNELKDLDDQYFPMNFYEGKAIRTYNSINKELYEKLFESKKKVYYKIRQEYNDSNNPDFKKLLLLIINSVGLVEFRVKNQYVSYPCGKARVNEKVQKGFNDIKDKLNNIELTNNDFRYIRNIKFNQDDFVYLDPPYLGTSQYKVKWFEEDEKELYLLLDFLNEKGVKFALSNFEDGKNHTNDYLRKWCGKYNIHNLNDNHFRLNAISKSKNQNRQEILITNY